MWEQNYQIQNMNYNGGFIMAAPVPTVDVPKMDETHYTVNRVGMHKTLEDAVKASRGLITYGDVTIHECKPIKTVSLSFKVEDVKVKK